MFGAAAFGSIYFGDDYHPSQSAPAIRGVHTTLAEVRLRVALITELRLRVANLSE